MLKNSKFKILKNEPNIHKKENSLFETQAISQKDNFQVGTNVNIPSDQNVDEAREWVEQNKK